MHLNGVSSVTPVARVNSIGTNATLPAEGCCPGLMLLGTLSDQPKPALKVMSTPPGSPPPKAKP